MRLPLGRAEGEKGREARGVGREGRGGGEGEREKGRGEGGGGVGRKMKSSKYYA